MVETVFISADSISTPLSIVTTIGIPSSSIPSSKTSSATLVFDPLNTNSIPTTVNSIVHFSSSVPILLFTSGFIPSMPCNATDLSSIVFDPRIAISICGKVPLWESFFSLIVEEEKKPMDNLGKNSYKNNS
jgi:hypothetical protein